MSNLRDQILASDDIESETMVIPQWGDAKILIRTMTAGERSTMMESAYNADTGTIRFDSIYGLIVVKSAYDPETGLPIFTSNDIAALNEKSGSVVERIAMRSMEMSGLTSKAVDEAGNDSSDDQTGDTSSS